MKDLILTMVLLLSDGQLAEQPASIMECQLVAEALARQELVEIDADDGRRHTVVDAECRWGEQPYSGPCEMEQS